MTAEGLVLAPSDRPLEGYNPDNESILADVFGDEDPGF